MTISLTLICILLLVAATLYAVTLSRRSGRDGEKLKQVVKTIDAIHKGNAAIDRARDNPDIAQRLRDRYKPK